MPSDAALTEPALTEPAPPWRSLLVLPGFMPDAIPFALRTTLSLLLAYALAFTMQIQAASTAGICVAIVAQPSAGMAFSKAKYRMMGTLCGGVAGVALLAAFPQDRTMLLMGYALWLAAGTFVGTLLRDFRSYGAVLSGYTAGIIAIAYIDAPQAGFTAALDRVAAISVGLLCVLLVNLVLTGAGAFQGLLKGLRDQTGAVTNLAATALDGDGAPDELSLLATAGAISALRAQATFAGTELPDGGIRSNGARHAIEALLGLIGTTRLLARAIGPGTPQAWRDHLRAVAANLRDGTPIPPPPPATDPVQTLLQLAAAEATSLRDAARTGLHTLETGTDALPRIRIQVSYDYVGALIGAIRAVTAIGLCALFTVVAGWGGATLLVIQSTAIIALLGTTPNPTQASMPFLFVLPPVALLVGAVKFLVLPLASGFPPFALAIGPVIFAAALMVRHPALVPYGTPSMLFAALLLSPSNPQTFDLAAYCNTVLELLLATAFVLLTFRLILPVHPSRRLGRVAAEIGRHWRQAGHQAGHQAALQPPSLLYDRLARVAQWIGPPTPARRDLVAQLYAIGELDGIERRARAALHDAADAAPTQAAAAARTLPSNDPAALLAAAQALLDTAPATPHAAPARAAAWLAAAALVLRRTPGLVRLGRHVAR